jgi:hypothetical protein
MNCTAWSSKLDAFLGADALLEGMLDALYLADRIHERDAVRWSRSSGQGIHPCGRWNFNDLPFL